MKGIITETLFILLVLFVTSAQAQTTVFTYQGKLTEVGAPANARYQMQFSLWDGPPPNGAQVGPILTFDGVGANPPPVQVTNGIFTVNLDFGSSPFTGADRFLEIAVKKLPGDTYTILGPRQQIASAPFAIRSLSAANANNADTVGGMSGGSFVLKNGDTMTGALNLPANGLHVAGNQLVTTGDNVGVGTLPAGNNRFQVVQPGAGSRAILGENSFAGNINGIGVFGRSINNPGFGTGGYFEGGGMGIQAYANAGNYAGAAYGVFGQVDGSCCVDLISTRVGVQGTATVTSSSFLTDGIRGQATGGTVATGVYGAATGGTRTIGIFGSASGGSFSNWAGYFSGNTAVIGRLAIGASEFTPAATLHVAGTLQTGLLEGGGGDQVCRYSNSILGFCNSSSIRFKTNIANYRPGLSVIQRLRPVSFEWKLDDKPDIGLIAEEVVQVAPSLVTRNDKGEIDGVRYDRLSPLFINAIKEQQAQIEAQQKQINEQIERNDRQQKQIDSMKELICSLRPEAEVCKENQ